MILIAGLGNPGKKYEQTRHNIGFMIIDRLAEDFSITLKSTRFNALSGQGRIQGHGVMLVKPMSFMNLSGQPVQQLLNYYRISGREMIVIHDDIDLPSGQIKIKEKGGHGGHNGVKSLINTLGGDEFVRIRIGVGRPETGRDAAAHVLDRFDKAESEMTDGMVVRARDAVVSVLCKGARESMNEFNRKQKLISSKAVNGGD